MDTNPSNRGETMKRWGRSPARSKLGLFMLASVIALACVLFYVLYRIIVPFQTENPLWHEVTVGEPVIDNWLYEGLNEEGYLQFRKTDGESTELAPNNQMLALDGKFVMIERASHEALVFAPPVAAVPGEWWIIGGMSGGFIAAVFVVRRKIRKRPTSFQSKSTTGGRMQSMVANAATGRRRHFRARKTSRR